MNKGVWQERKPKLKLYPYKLKTCQCLLKEICLLTWLHKFMLMMSDGDEQRSPTTFLSCQQGAPGPIGPSGPAGPSGEKVESLWNTHKAQKQFDSSRPTVLGRKLFAPCCFYTNKNTGFSINSYPNYCNKPVASLQGEPGPKGPSGPPGSRGTPVGTPHQCLHLTH